MTPGGQQETDAIARIDTSKTSFPEGIIAEHIAAAYEGGMHYDTDQKCWYVWDGTIWRQRLAASIINHTIKGFLQAVLFTHRGFMSDHARLKVFSHQVLSSTEKQMRLHPKLAVMRDAWDRDPYLMATPNGVVDLRSGHLRPGEPRDMITRITRSDIAPKGTKTPLFTAFLNKITRGDKELQKFFQVWFGLSLVGLVKEQKIVFLFGFGANGKNTLVDSLSALVGDYATRADIGMFMQQKHLPHPTGLAKIVSTPMVIGVEAPDEAMWNMSLLKMVTGEDVLAVRFMHANFFDAVVRCLVTLTGNHKPGLNDVDEAIKRRFLLVHIDYTIPEQERLPRYHDTLVAQEGPAILRWMVDGAAEYDKTNKLPIPKSVREASEEYFAEQDIMRQFIEENIEVDNRPKNERKADPWLTNAQEVLSAWKAFAGENRRAVNNAGFKTKLLRNLKSVEHVRSTKGIQYKGLRLKNAYGIG